MSKTTKKTVPVVTHRDGRCEPSNHEAFQFDTILPQTVADYKGIVYPLLSQGEENAKPTAELVRLVGCKCSRELQNIIAAEREHGLLILSTGRNGGGYFLPDDGEKGQREIAGFTRTLRSRALSTLRILRTANQALSGVEGQGELEGL